MSYTKSIRVNKELFNKNEKNGRMICGGSSIEKALDRSNPWSCPWHGQCCPSKNPCLLFGRQPGRI